MYQKVTFPFEFVSHEMHLDHLRIQYFLELLMTQHRPGVVFIFLIEKFDLVGPSFLNKRI